MMREYNDHLNYRGGDGYRWVRGDGSEITDVVRP